MNAPQDDTVIPYRTATTSRYSHPASAVILGCTDVEWYVARPLPPSDWPKSGTGRILSQVIVWHARSLLPDPLVDP